jgi:uncharacterized membrane protein YhaH (DUF805 family)
MERAMTFGDAIKICFKKYFDFTGRASRSEYWLWILFTFLLALGGLALDVAFDWGRAPIEGTGPLATLASVGTFMPTLAVSVRRLHDTNRSAWWLGGVSLGWLGFVLVMILLGAVVQRDAEHIGIVAIVIGLPLFGLTMALVVFYFLPGTPGANQYGVLEPVNHRSTRNVGVPWEEVTFAEDLNASRWVLSGFDSSGNIVRLEFDSKARSEQRYVIGRNSEVCDLVIDDKSVSRRHAEIMVAPSGVFIRDLGSSNGTRVNGQRVTNEPLQFPANGILAVGPIELSIFGS